MSAAPYPHQKEEWISACSTPPTLTTSPLAHMSSSTDHRWAVQNEEQTYLDIITKHSHRLQEVHWGLKPTIAPSLFPFPRWVAAEGRRKEQAPVGVKKNPAIHFLCLFWQPLRAPTTLAVICLHLLSHCYRFPQSIPMQRDFRDVDVFMSKGEILATGIWWLVQSMYSDLKMLLCWRQHKAFLRGYQCFG